MPCAVGPHGSAVWGQGLEAPLVSTVTEEDWGPRPCGAQEEALAGVREPSSLLRGGSAQQGSEPGLPDPPPLSRPRELGAPACGDTGPMTSQRAGRTDTWRGAEARAPLGEAEAGQCLGKEGDSGGEKGSPFCCNRCFLPPCALHEGSAPSPKPHSLLQLEARPWFDGWAGWRPGRAGSGAPPFFSTAPVGQSGRASRSSVHTQGLGPGLPRSQPKGGGSPPILRSPLLPRRGLAPGHSVRGGGLWCPLGLCSEGGPGHQRQMDFTRRFQGR